MTQPIIKSISYLLIMFIGVILKKLNILKKEDSRLLSKISVKLTLPAAVLLSFHNFVFQSKLLIVVIIGLVINFVMSGFSLLLNIKNTKEEKVIGHMNNSSFNVGSFALPYVTGHFDPSSIIYASMFDIGNSIYAMGLNLALAKEILRSDAKFSIKKFTKTLFSSLPFIVYIIMVLLLILNVELPNTVFSVFEVIGNSNIFIVMLMFGLIFELPNDKKILKNSIKILVIRYLSAAIVVAAMWYFFKISPPHLQVLTICLFAPMSSIIPSFLMELDYKPEVSSLTSSVSIIISIAIYTVLFSIWT